MTGINKQEMFEPVATILKMENIFETTTTSSYTFKVKQLALKSHPLGR